MAARRSLIAARIASWSDRKLVTCGFFSDAGRSQLRMAETEKYPHVTYFLNGGEEKPYRGEDRIMVRSEIGDVRILLRRGPQPTANGRDGEVSARHLFPQWRRGEALSRRGSHHGQIGNW